MNLKKTLTLAVGLAALVAAPLMAADVYTFDGAHSSIAFEVVHLGIFKARGTFDKFDGALNYDAKNPAKSSVNVNIDPASINTRNEMRDKHLRSEDFFFVEKSPTASFKSTKVEVGKEGALKVTGDLTLRGVTKSGSWTASLPAPPPMTGATNASASKAARASIVRTLALPGTRFTRAAQSPSPKR